MSAKKHTSPARTKGSLLGVLALGLLMAACTQAGEAADLPENLSALEIKYARLPEPDLLTAGQLTEEQFAALEELGYRHFINLRQADEKGTGWEEEEYADGSGSRYVRIEVAGAAGMTRENVEVLAAALEQSGDEPTVLYCASSNRVGALLALKAHWLDGEDAETALEIGKAAGMTRLEPKVRELLDLPASD